MFSRVEEFLFSRGHDPLARVRLCLFSVILVTLFGCGQASGLCVAQHMQGVWVNADMDGILRKITMQFKCCDQIFCDPSCELVCSPPQDGVNVSGPCASGVCDWGTVVPDYMFCDAASGYQATRVDATFKTASETRRLVILTFGSDSLLVHWSIDYPENSGQKDFSLIEYFRRQQCITLPGGKKLCLELARVKMDPEELIERATRERAAAQKVGTNPVTPQPPKAVIKK